MADFKFEVSKDEKIVNVYFEGLFNEKEVAAYEKKYTEIVESLPNPKEYEFHADCKKMEVIRADLLPELGKCIKQYCKDFKQIVVFKDKEEKILREQGKVQIKKLNVQDRIDVEED